MTNLRKLGGWQESEAELPVPSAVDPSARRLGRGWSSRSASRSSRRSSRRTGEREKVGELGGSCDWAWQ